MGEGGQDIIFRDKVNSDRNAIRSPEQVYCVALMFFYGFSSKFLARVSRTDILLVVVAISYTKFGRGVQTSGFSAFEVLGQN